MRQIAPRLFRLECAAGLFSCDQTLNRDPSKVVEKDADPRGFGYGVKRLPYTLAHGAVKKETVSAAGVLHISGRLARSRALTVEGSRGSDSD